MKRDDRRAAIEAVAAALFAERGYAGTSLEAVAEAAQVSRPVVYDHFGSKRDLHEALMANHTRALVAFIGEKVAGAPPDAAARLRAGFSAYYEFMESDPYAARMIVRDPLVHGAAGALDRRVQNEVTAGLASLLAQVARDFALDLGPPDRVERIAEALRWAVTGLITWAWEHPQTPREELVDTLMALVWDGLGSRAPR